MNRYTSAIVSSISALLAAMNRGERLSMVLQRPSSTKGQVKPYLAVVAIAVAVLLRGAASADDGVPPGVLRFRGHMAVGPSEGLFRRWRISHAVIDEEHPERSEVELEVDLSSLDTGNDMRDRHLRSADFFDIEHYPTATVRVSGVAVEDPQHFTVTVTLNLHGRSQSFPVRFAIVDRSARRITAEITLRRSDFGIGPTNSFLNPLRVDDEVQVAVEAIVPSPPDANVPLTASNPNDRSGALLR
jgi:polyisoprenoid-binding protein YceI